MGGYTTTPEERIGPGPPYTTPSLQANLFFREFLGIMSLILCWVPMKLLWRHGEFAAATWCVTTTILNIIYVVNGLLWRNDDVRSWYAGYGWCDLQVYTINALETIYGAAIFAMMRNLSMKVGLMRATGLSATEKRRRNVEDFLIMFSVAIIQVIVTYFAQAQRYNVSTLIGCMGVLTPSWVTMLFFIVPSPVYAVATLVYAYLTWRRFREVDRATRLAVNSNNSVLAQRQIRVRRKLYQMSMTVLVPFVPVQLLYLYYNLASMLPLQPYSYKDIHSSKNPYGFNSISFSTSDRLGFVDMNSSYSAVLTIVALFWFFGLTKEAINTYREYLLALGFGRYFPGLHKEYDPDRSSNRVVSWAHNMSRILRRTIASSTSQSEKNLTGLPTTEHFSQATSSTITETSIDRIKDLQPSITSLPPHVPSSSHHGSDEMHTPPRRPFAFRTDLLRSLRLLFAAARQHGADEPTLFRPRSGHSGGTEHAAPVWGLGAGRSKVQTRVWSEEDGDSAGEVRKGGAAITVETQIKLSEEQVGDGEA